MSLRPKSQDDGPVKVWLDDGDVLTFDRLWHNQSGTITFYDVERDDDSNRVWKEGRAKTYPAHKIEEIQYLDYGK